jgi:hypothetical protein
MADKIEAEGSRFLPSSKNNGIKEKVTKNPSIRDLSSQSREIANQLSVINLCSFKLRGSLVREHRPENLRELDEYLGELDTIEMVVMEAVDLLDKFNESLKAVSGFTGGERTDLPLSRPSNTSTGNIYYIPTRLRRDR